MRCKNCGHPLRKYGSRWEHYSHYGGHIKICDYHRNGVICVCTKPEPEVIK